ncbi:hypothetical protein GHT06_018237 [Daphnia sinensis]|uniref:Uncharacterized protein n=1 Tax=Daphnia sinensis TaxID=1820382 RepID=A0AAD5PQP2_9CRUS|nr:hypothetical protein GHT06_018237 [Daphnia sinensis]
MGKKSSKFIQKAIFTRKCAARRYQRDWATTFTVYKVCADTSIVEALKMMGCESSLYITVYVRDPLVQESDSNCSYERTMLTIKSPKQWLDSVWVRYQLMS